MSVWYKFGSRNRIKLRPPDGKSFRTATRQRMGKYVLGAPPLLDALASADRAIAKRRDAFTPHETKKGSYERQGFRMRGIQAPLSGSDTLRGKRGFIWRVFRGAEFFQIAHNRGFRYA